jgi:carbamoyltransferase
MKVCGVSAHFHDSAAALVVGRAARGGGGRRSASTRRKGDAALPARALRFFCLDQAGIAASELDAVVFYEKPLRKFLRIGRRIAGQRPARLRRVSAARCMPGSSASCGSGSDLARVARGASAGRSCSATTTSRTPRRRSWTQPHRFSGVSWSSTAVGEWTTTSLGVLRRERGGLGYEVLDSIDFPHSLGLFYSGAHRVPRFHVNEGEYKVMASAPYGVPRFAEALRRVVPEVPDAHGGLFRLDLDYFEHDRSVTRGWSRRMEELLGPPNPPHRRIQQEGLEPAEFQRLADVAASLQLVLEERLLALVRRARERTGERFLCYGGGVALNSVANGKIARSGFFERVFVHPAAGDAGGALGAALAFAASQGETIDAGAFSPYLGSALDGGEPEPAANAAWGPRLAPDALADSVAELLERDLVVGWAHGRAEWGPRALGARSILARPDPPGQKERLNRLIKHREGYRPFAPIVTDERADELFDGLSPGRDARALHARHRADASGVARAPVRGHARGRLGARAGLAPRRRAASTQGPRTLSRSHGHPRAPEHELQPRRRADRQRRRRRGAQLRELPARRARRRRAYAPAPCARTRRSPIMMDRVVTLVDLFKRGLRREHRPYFVVLVILVLAGVILSLGAAYPILSPFLYSMF